MRPVTDRTLWVGYDITRAEGENSKSCPFSIRCTGRTIPIETGIQELFCTARTLLSPEKTLPHRLDTIIDQETESMADDPGSSYDQAPRTVSMALALFWSVSGRRSAKIRAWAEQGRRRAAPSQGDDPRTKKLSYIRTISTNDLTRLVNHHPVWKTHCNVYMDQIQKATLTYEEENALVRCTLKPHVVKFLKIFRVAGEGNVLCINSDRGLRYEDRRTGQGDGVRRIPVNNVFYSRRENMFRYVERIRAQWIFTGDTWGLNDCSLGSNRYRRKKG